MQHKWYRVFVAQKFCVSVFSSKVCCIVCYFIGNKQLLHFNQPIQEFVCLACKDWAGFLKAGNALQFYICMTESTSPVVWTGDLKKTIIVTFWFQGLFQCCNGRTGTVWSYTGISAGWLQCPVACLQCLLVCGLAQEELSGFGAWLLMYIKRCFAFFWRYIYVADVLDHNVYVMEKHANWSLTHVKVRGCCSLKRGKCGFWTE